MGKYGGTPILWAADNGHADVVGLLMELRADIHKANDGGETPLYRAAYNGHADVVKMLVAGKADINQADNAGWTPLYVGGTVWERRCGEGAVVPWGGQDQGY